jgi:hypothetical protein
MKNYSSITSAYLGANGLVKVYVRDAATGLPILRVVKRDLADDLKQQGRICNSDGL